MISHHIASVSACVPHQQLSHSSFFAAGTLLLFLQGPVALVLAPTRELASQVAGVARHLRATSGLRTVCVYGGVPKEQQVRWWRKGREGGVGRVLTV